VLVLQHPDEAKHPLNTGRLAVLGLQHAELLVGEHFPQLDGIVASAGRALLLFPEKEQGGPPPARQAQGRFQRQAHAPPCSQQGQSNQNPSSLPSQSNRIESSRPQPREAEWPGALAEGGQALLIVPDGTWRKARKIVQMNPVLNTLPRLSLPPGEPSEYRVRKASEPVAVSTIEAISRSLSLLEPEQDFQRLLAPFRVLVQQQVQAMGEEVYRRNYQGR